MYSGLRVGGASPGTPDALPPVERMSARRRSRIKKTDSKYRYAALVQEGKHALLEQGHACFPASKNLKNTSERHNV